MKNTMNFSVALEMLHLGYSVRRQHWPIGTDITLQFPDTDSKMTQPYIYQSDIIGEACPAVLSNITLLATDWEISE